MKNRRAVVAIDVGRLGAYTVYDVENKLYLEKEIFSSDKSLCDVYNKFDDIIKTLHNSEIGNILFIIGEAFGQRVVVKKHSKFYGVIEMLCEENRIQLNYESDSTCRATVLGKGNGRRKDLVHEKYKGKTPDISDCMLFTDYELLQLGVKEN